MCVCVCMCNVVVALHTSKRERERERERLIMKQSKTSKLYEAKPFEKNKQESLKAYFERNRADDTVVACYFYWMTSYY